jgi:hypothetical protein
MPHERPPEVKKAMLKGDKEALSAMGKAGARKKDEKAAALEEFDIYKREQAAEEAARNPEPYTVSEDGDVLPPH